MRRLLALLIATVACHCSGQLAPPTRLVDTDLPCAAPAIADLNGDGCADLIVGVFRSDPYTGARAKLFRNVGTKTEPSYTEPVWIHSQAGVARVSEVCHTGFGPQILDINGDGIDDLVSGTQRCQLTVFSGNGTERFDPPELVEIARDEDQRLIRYNCRLHLHDWDRDGDVDVLATVRKGIWLIPNVGSSEHLSFGRPIPVLQVEQWQDALSSCFLADWDMDGTEELLVGRLDGSVRLMEITDRGKSFEPLSIQDSVELIGPGVSPSRAYSEEYGLIPPDMPSSDVRICVFDHNHDGLPDIILGDSWRASRKRVRHDTFSDVQLMRYNTAKNMANRLAERIKALEVTPSRESQQARLQRLQKIESLRDQCGVAYRTSYGKSLSTTHHGSVWLFLRLKK